MLPNDYLLRMKEILKDEYPLYLKTFDEPNIKAIKVNTNKITVDEFVKICPFSLEKIPYTDDSFYVTEPSLGNHPFHHAGLFYMQDPAAMIPANILEIKPNWFVLDMCAAPGGKSIGIASKLTNGVLISNEINYNRSKILYSNIERMGLKNTIILNNDSYKLKEKFKNAFDLIFLDAPCSGEGMFRKDKMAIKDWSLNKVKECSLLQKELLKNADFMLKEGGIIVYSTCTYSLEENEYQITNFLNNFDYEVLDVNPRIKPYVKEGFLNESINKELKKAVRFYPHIAKGEGQFAVILKKKGKLKPNEFNFKTNDLIDNYIKNDVSIKLNAKMFHNCFYNSLDINLDGLKIISSGVDLGEVKNNRFIYHHYFVTAYGKYFQNKLDLDLNDPRLIMYLKGYEITDETVNNGYGVICVCGYPLGLFKASNGILKNHYPKGLRING